ncbi:uncharacterized protein LAESUDRAFT_728207 [Laetiporus sulphureus 93-53]|uniref:Uncharacterized protein n=1 Tax=Laetiporus sulphureus 93-53 TaxID=1314785 RepID=A0A165D967_9APHY|nr:uncharacterized protein LAESUDRAFT_728207 [Laetiporus sulphureus 93-53]KZT04366.1 hypothetical protein LAESUDRAFT_728207 [Laetiporus sulphureus 93-53]
MEDEGEDPMSDQISLTIASSSGSSSSTSVASRQLEHVQLAYDFMAAYSIVEQRRVAIEHAKTEVSSMRSWPSHDVNIFRPELCYFSFQ